MRMKSLPFLFIVLLFSTTFTSNVQARTNTADSLALVDLYNNANGSGWNKSTHWLTAKPLSQWYGVTVTANRVTNIVLNFNKLKGQLPASLGNLSELTGLEFGENNLSGSLNPIVNLTKLLKLDLAANAFSGNISGQISKLTQLQYFSLSSNQFTGNIPASLFTLKSLVNLFLGNNQLSGLLPENIGNLGFLRYLYVNNNQLSGPLPPGFYKLYNLVTAELENNQFSGQLSGSISTFSQLVYLILDYNQFTGPIPPTITQLGRLSSLYLQNNRFSGSIPGRINYCEGLTYFDFSNNQFSGTLPSTIASLTKLSGFNVSNNQLSGEFPPQLITMSSALSIKASGNHLTFSKNVYSNDSSNLSAIDISRNNFNFNGLEYIVTHVSMPTSAPQAGISIHQHRAVLSVSAGGKLSNNTYTWNQINGNLTVIQADSSFTPALPGSYYVTVSNKIAKKLTLISDTVNVTAAITGDEPQLMIKPNPVKNVLIIYGFGKTENSQVTVSDMKGYIWLSALSNKQKILKLDAHQLKQGSYIISVNNGKKLKTIHFIKE